MQNNSPYDDVPFNTDSGNDESPVLNGKINRRGSVGSMQHENHMFHVMAKTRRGSTDATQFHMALRQLLDAMKFRRHLFGVEVFSIDTLFRAIDTDQSGYINKHSLGDALHRLGVGLSNSQIDILLEAMNADSNGNISYKDFERTLKAELFMRQDEDSKMSKKELSHKSSKKKTATIKMTKSGKTRPESAKETYASKRPMSINVETSEEDLQNVDDKDISTGESYQLEQLSRKFFDSIEEQMKKHGRSKQDIFSLKNSIKFLLDRGEEARARKEAMRAFSGKWPHGLLFPPDIIHLTKAAANLKEKSPSFIKSPKSPSMAFGRPENFPAGRDSHMPIQVQDGKNTKNMSKPRDVAPALSADDLRQYVSPRQSAFKEKRIKNRRSSIDENGRRMPWEVSNGDELFDEFGSYNHDEKRTKSAITLF